MFIQPPAPPTVPGYIAPLDFEYVDKWKVLKKLGEGGFGAVYKVKNDKNEEFALKTEKVNAPMRVLKMEVVVLRSLNKSGSVHCCTLYDQGKTKGMYFFVMTLVGPSLHEMRVPDAKGVAKFTMGCAVSIGVQCLEAIQELHNIGFLHRDIKPGNFAICLTNPRLIILFDFGMCRRYLDNQNAVRNPRWASGFRGTLRYAAISCHISREMCRKDDLESWMYQQVELTTGCLPWKNIEDNVDICHAKEKSRTTNVKELFAGCPKEYIHMLFYIDTLTYYDTPNYAIIRGLLKDVMESNKLTESYDWEIKNAQPETTGSTGTS